MVSYTAEDILERVDELISLLEEHEIELYVAVELAHQLRDEIVQTLSPDEEVEDQ